MKTIVKTILLVHLSICTFSQFSIQGKVVNTDTEGVPFSNILLLNQNDSSMFKGTIATESGIYLFENIVPGNYLLLSSFVGYDKTFSTAFFLNKNYEAENLILTQGSELDEVVVKAYKALYVNEIDRMIINVSGSIVSAGGTALEILERSPGVSVNRQNNSIALTGKTGVVVMINGKISYMPMNAVIQMLQGMSSDNIETIELITTPPAKYDAEGNAGYINIVLKKKMDEGLNGTYTVSAGYGKGFRTNDNVGLNFRKKKLNIFGTYSYVLQNGVQPFSFGRDYVRDGNNVSIFSEATRPWSQENHNARLGVDYEITDKTLIGIQVNSYHNVWLMDAFNQSTTKINNAIDSYVELNDVESNTWKHIGANFNLNHKFSDKSNVSFDVDYLNYNNNPNDYANSFFNANKELVSKSTTNSTKVTPLYTWVSRLDFRNTVNEKVGLGYGIKGSYNNFENAVAVQNREDNQWISDPSLTSSSFLNESILAAYVDFDYKINAKTSVKAGLRYEHTDSELENQNKEKLVDRNYGILFPTVYLSHKINKDLSMNWSFSKRITRPTFNDMAPFVILLDPNTFISGNAAVQPAISNSLKYAINYKSIYFGLDYSHQDYTIAGFQQRYDAANDRFIFSAANLDYTKSFSATFGSPLKVNDWWNMNNNFIFIWQKVKSSIYVNPLEFAVYTYQVNSTQSFKIRENLNAEASAFLSGPSFFGTAKLEAFYGINLGMQYKLRGDKGSFRLALTDLAESIKYKTSIEVKEESFKTNNVFDFSNRTIMLTYTSSFGRKEIKSSRGRQGGAAEERARVH